MKKNSLKLVFLYSVILIFAIGSGCRKKADEEITSTSSSTSGPTPILPIANPQAGLVTDTNAYARLYENGLYNYHVGKMSDFSKACTIDPGTTGQILDCLIDINEMDLYFNGITLQANFPKTMCAYVTFQPYWHYNYETGYGPSAITINKTTLNGKVTAVSCTIPGGAAGSCTGTEASYGYDFTAQSEKLSCVYDFPTLDFPKNCCLGTYTKTVNITETGSTPSSSTTTTQEKWGGSVSSCIGGAAHTNWSSIDPKSGYPLEDVYFVKGKGFNQTYTVSAPILNKQPFTLQIANYYKPYNAATPPNHRHTGYVLTRTTDLPYMVDPVDDRSGSLMLPGNPSYLWKCLDENAEVVNTLRVFVREWNTQAQYAAYITSNGTSGDPDINGVEGVDCAYSTGNGVCDDFADLDYKDTSGVSIYKGPYPIGSRNGYFPFIAY